MVTGFSRYLIVLVGLLVSNDVLAQSKYAIGSFASWPVGSYASTKAADGSFAQPGWGIMFENEARFKSWPRIFSMGLHLSYQQNTMDNNAMNRAFSTALNVRTEATEAKYRPLLITLGPFFDIPVSSRLDLGIKTGIGFAITNIDAFNLSLYAPSGGAPIVYNIGFKTSPAFTYLLGLNAEYTVNDIIVLTSFVDFSGARSKVDSFVGTLGRTQSNYDLLFLNTGLGIAIIFD
jgi:hypothetical protein